MASWSGDAVTADSMPGIKIKNLTICGWERAVVINGCERFEAHGLKIDCKNGIEVTDILDSSYIDLTGMWPFYGQAWLRANGNPGTCLVRPGTGLYLHELTPGGTAADGLVVTRLGAYGYRKAVRIINANACFFDKLWLDNKYNQQDTEHPTFGLFQAIGFSTEGDVQNCQTGRVHVDSHYYNFFFAHDGGDIGGVIDTISSGQAKNTQLYIGPNRGRVNTFQYAGEAVHAIYVQSGVQDWRFDTINGDESTATNAMTFGVATDAMKVQWDDWTHNGVLQQSLVDAYPPNATPGAGSSGQITWNPEVTDRLGEYNPANGTFTAMYARDLHVTASITFTAADATAGTHSLEVQQNDNRFDFDAVVTNHTKEVTMRIDCVLYVNKGDTVKFFYAHERGATWDGGKSRMRIEAL